MDIMSRCILEINNCKFYACQKLAFTIDENISMHTMFWKGIKIYDNVNNIVIQGLIRISNYSFVLCITDSQIIQV